MTSNNNHHVISINSAHRKYGTSTNFSCHINRIRINSPNAVINLKQASIPLTYNTVNSTNDTILLDGFDHQLRHGKYDWTTLATEFKRVLVAHNPADTSVVEVSPRTGKLEITTSATYVLNTHDNSFTAAYILGFYNYVEKRSLLIPSELTIDMTGSPIQRVANITLTSGTLVEGNQVIDIGGPRAILVRLIGITNNFHSDCVDRVNGDVIAKIPITENHYDFAVQQFDNSDNHWVSHFSGPINELQIIVTDELGRELDLQNKETSFTFIIKEHQF